MEIKAEKVISLDEMMQACKGISWTVYVGDQLILADKARQYINAFLMSGEPMPISGSSLKLNIHSLEVTYDDHNNTHKVVAEGILVK